MGDFSHLESDGTATMVDIGTKETTARVAKSVAYIETGDMCLEEELSEQALNELSSVVRIAAIQAAKKTSDLIPMCHPLPLEKLDCHVKYIQNYMLIECTAKTTHRTGVEMEAMTAASIAALTAYDMIKSRCPEAIINNVHLKYKEGGKSGAWQKEDLN